jgi:amicyanin
MKKNIILYIVIIIIFLFGCAQVQKQTTAPITTPATKTPTQPQTHNVEIVSFAFNPAEITIKKGDTVTWTNKADIIHDVTIDNGLFDHDLNPGESFSFKFNESGTYDYHCDIHPSMKAKIIVE